jgi:CheY-like chemotaxis protein
MSGPRLPELVLVEDNEYDEFMSLRAISDSGVVCNVTVLRNGQEALEHLLHPETSEPSLIVLDYELPKMTGFEVLTRLRNNEKTRFVPVVMFSGSEADTVLAQCYRGGANSCVAKPSDAKEYMDRLSQIARYWLKVNHQVGQEPLDLPII